MSLSTCAFAQKFKNIEFETIYGYQENDTRFFGLPDENTEAGWGTSFVGLRINKKIIQKSIFSIQAGIGYAREVNTYSTPYDQCFDRPGEACQLNLPWIDKYSIDLIQAPLMLNMQIISGLSLNCELTPQFDFFKKVVGSGSTSDFGVNLYSIEVIPKIEYNFQKLSFNVGFRCLQIKKIDSVYLYGGNFLEANPGYLEKSFDTFNPSKIVLSVGYKII